MNKKQYFQRCLKNNSEGWTLIELLMVIGIIFLLVTTTIFALYYKANEKANVMQTKSAIMSIVSATKNWRTGRNSYTDLSMDALCADNQLSKNMCTAGYINPWGGVYSVTASGDNDTNFTVIADKIPTGDDTALGQALRSATKGQNGIEIDSGTLRATFL